MVLVLAIVISTLIRTFCFEQFRVPTGSMEQTLEANDRIFVSKLSDYQRGDVVVFEDQLDWLTDSNEPTPWWRKPLELVGFLPNSSQQYLVKRLIGLPGDRVSCCSDRGKLEVNGYEIDEPYLYRYPDGSQVAASDQSFDVVVPQGHFFVLGDHRNNSADSRYHLCDGNLATPNQAFPDLETI
ncbi:MAG: signal peptidase I, partial [Propionibacteriaceae bacterium]|nr:signal peptidase I [Propionibacteriaceae bacterium]